MLHTMASAELLSRLTAKNHSWEIIPASIGALTAFDIAAMMGFAKLTPWQSSLLRYKWAKDQSEYTDLIVFLYASIENLDEVMNYTRYRPNLIWDICEMAIKEYCTYPTCRTCLGQKFKREVIDSKPTGRIIPCVTCHGMGIKSGKREEMVWNLGLTPQEWRRYGWSKLYRSLIERLDSQESEAFKSLHFGAE